MKYKVKPLSQIGEIEKIFFVGIKGVGVAPLAIIAKQAGLTVAGSDVDEEFITDKHLDKEEIQIFKGFQIDDIANYFSDADRSKCLVITTGAHKGFDNEQVKWARDEKITILTQGQALALFMEGEIISDKAFIGVSIAGSHGKTTISSLLATTMKAMGLDPSYSVGTGEVFPLGSPGHFGSSEYFVAEADEYASEPVHDRVPKFLYQHPKYAIFNNIDFDHPDFFRNIDDIADAFLEFAGNIKSGGILFLNGDDEKLLDLKKHLLKDVRVILYGERENNFYRISKIVEHGLTQRFTVFKGDREFGVFELSVQGNHNAKNALSVVALLSELGYEANKIRICLKVFLGTKRRTEIVGTFGTGATIIDDYGHHPNEIQATIKAVRGSYPDKKIVCVFQPHTISRTKALLQEFSQSFENCEKLILLPIFKSMRDTENDTLEPEVYRSAFSKNNDVMFIETFTGVVEYLRKNYSTNEFVVMTIGAGDVYKIAGELHNG